MNDKIYLKKEKSTSRKQQIRSQLAHLDDALRENSKEKVDLCNTIVCLKQELTALEES